MFFCSFAFLCVTSSVSFTGFYTEDEFFFFVLLSLFSSDLSLSVKLTSDRNFSENFFGYPLFFRLVLKLCMLLLNVTTDEFVLRRRNASPFMNPFLTPGGWHE